MRYTIYECPAHVLVLGCGVEDKLGLAVMQVHTEGRPAHHPHRLLGTEQAAGPGGLQLTDAAGRPKGNHKVLFLLWRKQHHRCY